MILRRLASSGPASFKLPPTIRQLLAHTSTAEPSKITVSGWIKSVRRQKNVAFAVLTDGSCTQGLQAVFVGGGDGVKGLTNGAAVRLTGKLVPSPGARQDKELLVDLSKGHPDSSSGNGDGVHILGNCDPEAYPIQKQALSTEYLRDHAHLRARTDAIAAMIRLRDGLFRRISSFFEDQGFCYVHTPIITGNDAEGAGEAFKIADVAAEHPAAVMTASSLPSGSSMNVTLSEKPFTEFFSRPAYLTVSHQLHLEALATALSRVYTLSPCFRAEPSLTGRHLAEFSMLEAEWAFTSSAALIRGESRVEEVCRFVEGCLRYVVGSIASSEGRVGEEIDVLWKGGDEKKRMILQDAFRVREPWARISYSEAVKELEAHNNSTSVKFNYEPKWGRPLQSEHERWLAETLIGGPVFIQDYPSALKPFYMRQNDDGVTVACFDLVVPHMGELVGGSVREERIEVLEGKMRANLGADLGEYKWYLDLRRYGGAPHVGFGMGFERLVGWIGGIENVRECVPMPRWAGRMLL